MNKIITIALAGNPNAGKTSLFNQLTGARAHVGNYPGVTVEKKTGRLEHKGAVIEVVDLPGTYSLTAYSLEELVARRYIIEERPDLVVDVADAANLERNLYLAVQFMEIGVPVVLALNMMDLAEHRGLKIDVEKLSELLGVEVVPTVARGGKGMNELLDAVVRTAERKYNWEPKRLRYGRDLDDKITEICRILDESDFDAGLMHPRWLAIKALEGDSEVLGVIEKYPEPAAQIRETVTEVTRHLQSTVDDEPEGVIADHRYGFITSVCKQAVTTVKDIRYSMSDRIDMAALNRLLGPLILLFVLYGVYQFTFWISEAPVAWLEALFGWMSDLVRSTLPPGPIRSLLASGVIDGVGGVVGFVPLIAFMFFSIAILEDSGYMARIAFILDRVLRTFGLHGNSVLALMVGGGISGGCAVPGVMAARTLRDPKERLATILVTPFMNCGAKLPVFVVLIAAFFPKYQARMLFILTLAAWGMALIAARILRWTVLRGSHTPFVMELPPYRLPTLRGLLIHSWERVWDYLKKAGTVILGVSIVIWAMMTYPGLPDELGRVFEHQRQTLDQGFLAGPGGRFLADAEQLAKVDDLFQAYQEQAEDKSDHEASSGQGPAADLARAAWLASNGQPLPDDLEELKVAADAYWERRQNMTTLAEAAGQAKLRFSLAGRIGTALEGLSRPLGFDWRTNIALVGGFAAKEVVVSTLGTAYSLSAGGEVSDDSLAKRLAREPGWTPLTAFVLMLFVMMYSPCSVTLVAIGREAGWRWALFSMTYTTVSAYLICAVVATAGRALGLGV